MAQPSTGSVRTGDPWPFQDDALYRATRGFNLFVQGLFRGQPPGNYRWDPDPVQSEILVTDQNPVNLEVVEKRPAIVTMRGSAQWAKLGINQMVDYEWHSGRTVKQDLISFHMSFACLSREGVEAQRLAWFLFVMFPLFKPLIQRTFGLHNVGEGTLGPESGAGNLVQGSSSPEWKMVQLSVPVTLPYKFSIQPSSPQYIREVLATLTTNGYTPPAGTSVGGVDVNTLTPSQVEGLNQVPPTLDGVEVLPTTAQPAASFTQQIKTD